MYWVYSAATSQLTRQVNPANFEPPLAATAIKSTDAMSSLPPAPSRDKWRPQIRPAVVVACRKVGLPETGCQAENSKQSLTPRRRLGFPCHNCYLNWNCLYYKYISNDHINSIELTDDAMIIHQAFGERDRGSCPHLVIIKNLAFLLSILFFCCKPFSHR
jgi:hypothetical protein